MNEKISLAEQLHIWYLEATKELNPKSFNLNAQKSYEELTDEQKFIDKYIANKLNSHYNKKMRQYLQNNRKIWTDREWGIVRMKWFKLEEKTKL
jgi:hypothetical protein